MTSWRSYPNIYALGHRAVKDIFSVPTIIEEKVDGSQFSFGLFEDPVAAHQGALGDCTILRCKSKSVEINPEIPPAMFKSAVEYVKQIQPLLTVGWTYRGEVLSRPKHNVLSYDRTPKHNIILFDINAGEEAYLPYDDIVVEAARLDLEVVPLLAEVPECVADYDLLRKLIDNTVSVLGGQKIEGVVVKPKLGNLFGPDKKLLLGKFVGENFKEVAREVWGPGGTFAKAPRKDILAHIGARYATQTRWNKAVQHLRDSGKITDSPKDIEFLMREIPNDVFKEEIDDIKDMLFGFFAKDIRAILTRGVPEWYKNELLKKQFEAEVSNHE